MTPYRKPDHRHGGIQVRICGKVIQKEGDIICTLPPHHSPPFHAAIATDVDKGDIYASVKSPDGQVQTWLIAVVPE